MMTDAQKIQLDNVIAQCEWAIRQPSPTIIEAKKFYEETLEMLKEYELYIRHQKDGYAELEAEYNKLLKEQEHGETFTVIDTKTGEEADEYNIALHEDWAKHLCYCDMDGWAIMDDGTLLLVDECGRFGYADRERFKVVWNA